MSTALLLLAGATAVIAVIVATRLIEAYLKYRGARVIICPETQQPAGVRVDALHAAVTALAEPELRLQTCSRWPERGDCGQQCLAQIEASPEDCLIRHILTKWYEGKQCAVCGKLVGDCDWLERKPALMSPDRTTLDWSEIRPEAVPGVLASYSAVCWNCHNLNQFMREHPELVLDRSRPA